MKKIMFFFSGLQLELLREFLTNNHNSLGNFNDFLKRFEIFLEQNDGVSVPASKTIPSKLVAILDMELVKNPKNKSLFTRMTNIIFCGLRYTKQFPEIKEVEDIEYETAKKWFISLSSQEIKKTRHIGNKTRECMEELFAKY